MKHIAVFGCGWFGWPLAKALQQAGFAVTGSKTTAEGAATLTATGIRGVVLALQAKVPLPSQLLEECDALVVNIPPGLRRGDNDYLGKLAQLVALVKESAVQRLVFVSSTSAYQQQQGLLTETDLLPATEGGSAVLQQAEQMFQQLASPQRTVTIVRFAGLVGPGRHPGRFMAGRTGLTGASQAVNLVHLADCIAAVMTILEAPTPAAVYNLCAPLVADKQTFYGLAAQQLGLALPQFVEEPATAGKRIDGSFICRDLGFSYRYTDANSLLQACSSSI